MNARQKAKKYKKELERLTRQTTNSFYIEREPQHVDRFVVEQVFSRSSDHVPDDYKKSILLDKLIHNKQFFDSIKLETRPDLNLYARFDQVIYYIALDILRR